jgi:hypothetical protein
MNSFEHFWNVQTHARLQAINAMQDRYSKAKI